MPIYATSTYVQQSPGVHKGYEYARIAESDAHGVRALHRRSRRRQRRASRSRPASRRSRPCSNASTTARMSSRPTISMAARGGCSSGCASAQPGCRRPMSICSNADALEAAIRPNTRLIWIETPTNPLLKLIDLERVAPDRRKSAASGRRRQHLRDARGCSGRSKAASISWCTRPRNISTAIPTWSAACAVVGENAELREKLAFLQNAVGAVSGPVRQSSSRCAAVKTLALRMERHCASAHANREWLEKHPKVRRVYLSGPAEPSAARARARRRCARSAA